jgi:hypothetical protein
VRKGYARCNIGFQICAIRVCERPSARRPRCWCKEAALLVHHPDNAAIDDWIDAAYDWREWT